MLDAEQVRAGRAYLGWSQDDLAKAAALPLRTICEAEAGNVTAHSTTMYVLRRTMETAGIEFLDDGNGVRRRNSDFTPPQDTNALVTTKLLMTRTDKKVLFTALGFLAVIMNDIPQDKQALRTAAIAHLIEDFCISAVPEAFGEEQTESA